MAHAAPPTQYKSSFFCANLKCKRNVRVKIILLLYIYFKYFIYIYFMC